MKTISIFSLRGAFLAEQQHAETARAHQHTTDRRRNTQADQQGNENEFLVHKNRARAGCQGIEVRTASGASIMFFA